MSEGGEGYSHEGTPRVEAGKDQFVNYAKQRLDTYFQAVDKFDEIDQSTDTVGRRFHVLDTQVRPALVHTLDTMHPSRPVQDEFREKYGVGHIEPDDIGTTREDIQEAATWFVKERIAGWQQSIQAYKDAPVYEGNEHISKDDLAWFLGTEATFFPWHPEGGHGPIIEDMSSEGKYAASPIVESRQSFAYANIMDLFDVTPEEAGMTAEQWDEVKRKFFKMRYEHREDADKPTPYISHWGTRAKRGMILNGLQPQDILSQEYLASEDYDNYDFLDEDEQRANEEINFSKNRRLGHLNPASTSPVWGRED